MNVLIVENCFQKSLHLLYMSEYTPGKNRLLVKCAENASVRKEICVPIHLHTCTLKNNVSQFNKRHSEELLYIPPANEVWGCILESPCLSPRPPKFFPRCNCQNTCI